MRFQLLWTKKLLTTKNLQKKTKQKKYKKATAIINWTGTGAGLETSNVTYTYNMIPSFHLSRNISCQIGKKNLRDISCKVAAVMEEEK